MKIFGLIVRCASLSIAANADMQQAGGSNAIQKIIQMLTDMSTKAKQEMKDEQVAFATFTAFCGNGKPKLEKQIAKATEDIATHSATIGRLATETASLGDEIAELETSVSGFEADKKAAATQRGKDHAAFLEESTDYAESVDALDRALQTLADRAQDVEGESLLQISDDDKLPAEARSILTAFMGMGQGAADGFEPPAAKAYESQSGGIIDLLKKLKDEFRSKLAECQKEEMNSKHAHDMVDQDLTDSIENAKKDVEEKTGSKEGKMEEIAVTKGELASTVETKQADEDLLSNLDTECTEKKASFEEKQELRSDEIEAIGQAVEILEGDNVSGNAAKHLDLAQTGVAFLQIERKQQHHHAAQSVHGRVREFLSTEGARLKSKSLSLLAAKLAADPFAKVKQLIDDMLTRLLEEANADATKEGFCDTELGKSKVSRNKLSEDIDGLEAEIDDGKAEIMELTQSNVDLAKETEDLGTAMGEASDIRTKEKAKNEETIEDAVAAQHAVAAAVKVLKDFYKKAGEATAFLQLRASRRDEGIKMGSDEWDALANPDASEVDQGHQAGQQTFGDTFSGSQDAAGGVLGLLEVTLSDFGSLEADTKAGEIENEKTYKDYVNESKRSKAQKNRKVELNTSDKASAEAKLQESIKELKSSQDELIAADNYHERITEQCGNKGMTWEELVAARKAEIASLKEALEILGHQGSVETSA